MHCRLLRILMSRRHGWAAAIFDQFPSPITPQIRSHVRQIAHHFL